MVELSFKNISEAIRNYNFPQVDLVIGIARGGIIPASLIAYHLGLEMKTLKIAFRDKYHKVKYNHPQVINNPEIPTHVKKILIVDDLSKTGQTLQAAKKHLKNYQTFSFTLIGRADYVVFPKISDCVNWPWQS